MNKEFLELLANPNDPDHSQLVQVGDYLVCSKTGSGFPIVDGIPQLLPENEIPAEKMKELHPK